MTKDIKIMNLPDNIKLQYQFEDMSDPLQDDIKSWIEEKINKLADTYLKKILKKKDAEIIIDSKIQKNKKDKYNWNFKFTLDWEVVLYQREDFNKIQDLVDNAFDHLKNQINDINKR